VTGYAPLDVPKLVADGIWIIDGPPVTCRRMPHPTRAVVIRLETGGLWVHSPTAWTPELGAELEALGRVAHLVVPNPLHTTHISDWQARYPEAETWGVEAAVARATRQGQSLHLDHLLEAPVPWAGEIGQLLIAGSRRHTEYVFFHKASRSLILTDILQSLETAHLPVWMRPLVWFSGADDSDGRMPSLLRRAYGDKRALAASLREMIRWAPARVLLAHGRCYMKNARGELERAYRRELRKGLWDEVAEAAAKAEVTEQTKG
jgi:hypothetical protein